MAQRFVLCRQTQVVACLALTTSEAEFQIHRDGAVALTSRFSFELR